MTDAPDIAIVPFSPLHQLGVDELLLSIVPEYTQAFYHPDGKKMKDLYLLPGRYYWVAMAGGAVIGTAGVIIGQQYAILKSVFVAKAWRGQELQVSDRLLQTATETAKEYSCHVMYLGTMAQFIAAQRFYERHGYSRIEAGELPAGIPSNDFDTVFYKKELSESH